MRNLKLQYCRNIAKTVPNAKFLFLNPNESFTSEIFFIGTEDKLYSYNIKSASLVELAELPGIVGCEYLALENEICVATASGEVLLLNPVTKSTNEGTFCEVGIERMAWSPDQEVVVFVTKSHNVVVMTCAFESVSEQPLSDQYFGSGKFVSVGWGKKETQFHGTDGKPAANVKLHEDSSAVLIESLPQEINITWRADATYFAVSYVNPQEGRALKIYDKEGCLKFTSEKLCDLHPPVSWRPSGTWIAMPQKLPNKNTVALLEKNGLRHREIVLPFSLDLQPIRSLKWSPDSDILCVETKNLTDNSNNLYLYTIGNYHWYLKQVLIFKPEDRIAVYSWDNKIGEEKTLHVLLMDGRCLFYKWHFVIDKHQNGIVAVIDGKKLLITDFSKTVVPPPMCNQELEIDMYVNSCGFVAKNVDTNLIQLFVVDAERRVHFFKSSLDNPTLFCKLSVLANDATIQNLPLALGNMQWFDNQSAIATTSSLKSTQIVYIQANANLKTYLLQSTLSVKGTVNALCLENQNAFQLYVQTTDGRVQQIIISADHQLHLKSQPVHLCQGAADHLQWFALSHDLHCLIALRTNQCLLVDGQSIADDVTSFCLAGNYLAFTKLVTLYFLRLSDKRIVSERKIERGAKLVTVIPKDARTVLQLPRGNLEAISPRVLTLDIVGTLLENKQYDAAMEIVRKQRINLNIICDHNMLSFVENLDIFLQKIQNPNWLNLFLSDLQNEDFTATMYASNYMEGSQLYPECFKVEEKVLFLCLKLCELMVQNFEARFRLPIITAYVKIGKSEKALDVIWQEKQRNPESKEADDCLKYLLYLVDVNELYNLALGTYDFSLVLFVAQKSQKDPREFLPFLNELKQMEPNYRKFKIDEHLNRKEKALYNLAQCGESKINEALKFVEEHALFQQALNYYKKQENCYQLICCAFADYLRASGNLENASIMYERGNMLAQALLCSKNNLDWRRAIVLAKKDGQNVGGVALKMVPALEEHEMNADAFEILKTYGNNFRDALKCLLKAKLFSRALFETRIQDLLDEENAIDSLIKPELLLYSTILESNLFADNELFVCYKQRLLKIRLDKIKLTDLGRNLNENATDVDECDLLSDTTSVNSSRYTCSSRGSSGKTFRSSKNRRKHERKLLSLKPGNAFEDIALIDALYNHITKVFAQQQLIHDTCKALMDLQEDALARTIQHQLKSLLTLIYDSLDQIWIPELMAAQTFFTGPNIDYTQLQNEQRYAMLNPQKRFKPQLTVLDWEHEILR